MTSNISDLSDEELLSLIQGNDVQQPIQDQNIASPLNRFLNQATEGRANLGGFKGKDKEDLSSLSDEELLSLIGDDIALSSQSGQLGSLGSIGAGAAEGATDIFALAELGAGALAPEKPEGITLPRDVEAEIAQKPIEQMSFLDLFSLTDDDVLPPAFFGASKKEKETASQIAQRPFQTFQAGIPESEDEIGRVLRRGARFATGAATTGFGPGAALEVGGLGLAGQTTRELGFGEIPATIVELGGVGAARNLLRGKFKSQQFPKAVKSDIISTAKKLNLQRLPASVQVENGAVNMVENLAQQSVFGKKAYEQLFNEMREGLTENLEQALNNVSKRKFASLQEGGQTLQQEFLKAHRQARAFSRGFYGFAERAAEGITVPTGDIERGLERLSKKLGKTFVKESKEGGVKTLVDNFLRELKSVGGKDGRVPLDRLIAQRRSIRSMINYEDIGGAKEFLKGIDRTLTNTFEKVGRNNREWFSRFKEAESNFANQAKWFRNNLMKTVLFNESPEAIMNAINKPSDIAKLENALKVKGINKQTKEKLTDVINAVKRRKAEDILLDRVTGKDGKITLGKREAIPKNKRDMIAALLPKESRQVIKDIDKIRNTVAEAGQKFANTSRTFANAQDVGFFVTGIGAMLSGNLPLLAKSAGGPAFYFLASKMLTNKKAMDLIVKMHVASLRNNGTRFNVLAADFVDEMNKTMQENGLNREAMGFDD